MNVPDRLPEEAPNPSGALMSALTTEHYTLQAARSTTVVEANGRSLLFLSAVSGATVALALVAQLDRLGHVWTVFALAVLPSVLVLGLTTHVRLADLAVQDAFYARAIGRIRSYYLTIDPAAHQYWLMPAGDDPSAVMHHAGQLPHRWHHLSHTATAVDAVAAVVTGVLTGIVSTHFAMAQGLVVAGAIVSAVATFSALYYDQARRWRRSSESQPTRFHPSGQPVTQPTDVPEHASDVEPVVQVTTPGALRSSDQFGTDVTGLGPIPRVPGGHHVRA
jgi:hypothetical protein